MVLELGALIAPDKKKNLVSRIGEIPSSYTRDRISILGRWRHSNTVTIHSESSDGAQAATNHGSDPEPRRLETWLKVAFRCSYRTWI
jgi:hypothetical protein